MSYTITTPLYYVNDKPHLGSIYTTIACDVLARYKRLNGENVIFITGVDEHGLKIQRTANLNNVSPQNHCNRITSQYQSQWDEWRVSNHKFVRTTSNTHKRVVKEFFNKVKANDDIYLGRQQGWYCVGCEEYKEITEDTERPFCNIHQKGLEWRDEENLFFKLSNYQKEIEELINSDYFIYPIQRRNEIINFVKGGLRDFSISRVNLDWGIDVPGFPGHTFYVWFDALAGYLSSLLIDQQSEINLDNISNLGWPVDIHVIGKDILRFHAVYWPAMLLSAKLPLPKSVFGHGFLTREGQKMGKSLGNVLDPRTLLDAFGVDPIRWFLIRDIQFGSDGDFKQLRFVDTVNNDLANTFGNLLNRTVTMSRKWYCESIPQPNNKISNHLSDISHEVITKYFKYMDQLNFQKAAELILKLSTAANVYLNDQCPWTKIKDPANKDVVANILYSVLETCRISAILLQPIIPDFSNKMLLQLGIENSTIQFDESLKWGLLKSDTKLPEPNPILVRLELNENM